jgi:hypothetical protein
MSSNEEKPESSSTTDYPGYPLRLGDLPIGIPFEMLNYDGMYKRVQTQQHLQTYSEHRGTKILPFNDDGYHVPIVEEKTGNLIWMSKIKPCRKPVNRWEFEVSPEWEGYNTKQPAGEGWTPFALIGSRMVWRRCTGGTP